MVARSKAGLLIASLFVFELLYAAGLAADLLPHVGSGADDTVRELYQRFMQSKFQPAPTQTTVDDNVTNTTDVAKKVSGAAKSATHGASSTSSTWVIIKPCGVNFCGANGSKFYAAGLNSYLLATANLYKPESLERVVSIHAGKNAKVIRVFTHGDGYSESSVPFQLDATGKINSAALQHLDLMLAVCAKYQVRVIMTLTNFWNGLGGIQWYVNTLLGEGARLENFYTNARVRAQYKKFVKALVTRTNTVTKKPYKSDPTIFAWELGNELQTQFNYERNRGMAPGQMTREWACEMATYIKSLDKNHMVAYGGEGFMNNGPDIPWFNWLYDGGKGEDFEGTLACAAIDFGTVHAYPQGWGVNKENLRWVGPNHLFVHAAVAHKLGKPVILEEMGMSTATAAAYGGRDGYFRMMQGFASYWGYAGTLVWGLYADDKGQSETSGTFGYGEDGGAAMIDIFKFANDIESGMEASFPKPEEVCYDVIPGAKLDYCTPCSVRKTQGFCEQKNGTNAGSDWGYLSYFCLESCRRCEQWMYKHLKTCAATNSCTKPVKTSIRTTKATPDPPKKPLRCPNKPLPGFPPYPCYLRKSWGQCYYSWMDGYCNNTCNKCPGDPPPPTPKPTSPPKPPCPVR